MCGIVGYVGVTDGRDVLLDSLKRLEYRGYDSAGIAMIGVDEELKVVRSRGKIALLEQKLRSDPVSGTIGIGHTRWATHGRPSDENAHPHRSGPFVVVHNGIIENYAVIKGELQEEGFSFSSETDTEVIVKLAEREWRRGKSYQTSIADTLRQLRGSYAVVFLSQESPGELVAARKESPLILGIGDKVYYVASDVTAILPYTNKIVYMEDGDIARLCSDGYVIENLEGRQVERSPVTIDWNPVMAEKAGYRHFMLKEIYEQPHAIINTFRGSLNHSHQDVCLDNLNLTALSIKQLKKIVLVACGTSYHACLVGKYTIERMCQIPVEVDLGSEFRYRRPLIDEHSLLIAVSQSGETADTRAALQEGIDQKASCKAIVNVVGSSLARMADGVIYTHAGPEIGVASTKAFTTQVVALYLLSLYCSKMLGRLSQKELAGHIQELVELPHKIEKALSSSDRVSRWAKRHMHAQDFLYLGRGVLYPIALEGALKLKEISYIHAEGYAAGEMKHGPIALIDENMPVVVLLKQGLLYEKMLSNVQEVKARGGQVLALIEGEYDEKIGTVDQQLLLPRTSEWLAPILFAVPLQLLAYHIAVLRGTDVDQPRNLAKSVRGE